MKVVLLLVSFALSLYASPSHAPICDTTGALAKMTASSMGAPGSAPIVTLTSNQTSYRLGQKFELTLKADSSFKGILLYAVSSSNASQQVGSFDIPTGFQNNKAECPNSESENSVITHSSGQTYNETTSFQYTASSSISGNLTFHLILVKSSANQGYDYVIQEKALEIPLAVDTQVVVVEEEDDLEDDDDDLEDEDDDLEDEDDDLEIPLADDTQADASNQNETAGITSSDWIGNCSKIIERKEVNQLTDEEWQIYVDTIRKAATTIDSEPLPNELQEKFPNRTIWESGMLHHRRYAPHKNDGTFLYFHRYFLTWMERKLQKINPEFKFFYWDTARDYMNLTASKVWNYLGHPQRDSPVIDGPLENLTFSPYLGISPQLKNLVRNWTFADRSRYQVWPLAKWNEIRGNRDQKSFLEYSDEMLVHHGNFHNFIGGKLNAGETGWDASVGTMTDVTMSPLDPFFYVHHSFIDYIHQQNQVYWKKAGKPDSHSVPAQGLDFTLQGFQAKIKDVLDVQDVCVRYKDSSPSLASGSSSAASSSSSAASSSRSAASSSSSAASSSSSAASRSSSATSSSSSATSSPMSSSTSLSASGSSSTASSSFSSPSRQSSSSTSSATKTSTFTTSSRAPSTTGGYDGATQQLILNLNISLPRIPDNWVLMVYGNNFENAMRQYNQDRSNLIIKIATGKSDESYVRLGDTYTGVKTPPSTYLSNPKNKSQNSSGNTSQNSSYRTVNLPPSYNQSPPNGRLNNKVADYQPANEKVNQQIYANSGNNIKMAFAAILIVALCMF